MKKRTVFATLALLLVTSVCQAAEVPTDLSLWREWALHGHEEQVCPPVFNDQGDLRCYWPSAMELDINGKSGRFDLKVRLFAPSWVALPGGERIWPQDVLVQGKKAEVTVRRQNSPALYLDPGEYRITGSFSWDKMPESIPVPRDSGLVTLAVDGAPIRFPDFRSGQLWLKDKGEEEESAEDSLEIQVYRLMDDMVPFRAVTRLEVDVAGQQLGITEEMAAFGIDKQQLVLVTVRPRVSLRTVVQKRYRKCLRTRQIIVRNRNTDIEIRICLFAPELSK